MGRRERERWEERHRVICAYSVDEARQRALRILADIDKYTIVRAQSAWVSPPVPLGPLTAEFFDWFESVSAVYADEGLGREHVRPSEIYPDLICIGYALEHAEILTPPGSDTIYVDDGSEEDRTDESYPSVYHCIVFLDDLLCDE